MLADSQIISSLLEVHEKGRQFGSSAECTQLQSRGFDEAENDRRERSHCKRAIVVARCNKLRMEEGNRWKGRPKWLFTTVSGIRN